MKKLLFIFTLCSLAGFMAYGQSGHDRSDLEKNPEIRAKIEAYRTAFYTEKLQLTPDEAQNFWPLFREMNQRSRALKKEFKTKRRPDDFSNASDAEIKAGMKRHFEFKQKSLDLKKEYAYKFLNVLPARKTAMLPVLEHEFKRTILKEFRKRKGEENERRRH